MLSAVDDLPIFIQQVRTAGDGTDSSGGIKYCRHHQRQNAWQDYRIQRAHNVQLPISELPFSSLNEGMAKTPEKWTLGSKIKPTIEIPIMVSRMPLGTFSFRADNHCQPHQRHHHRKGREIPSATGRPSSGFLITRPTPLAAISSRNRPIPIPCRAPHRAASCAKSSYGYPWKK